MKAIANHRRDILLTIIAAALLLPTCWYPYGSDQSTYHYFGAGWLRGLIPFRDCFDVKPPGIYALYALAIALFGPTQVGIRVIELVGIIVVGWIIGSIHRSTEDRNDGVSGVCVFLLAAWYVTTYGFWDTAQAELWVGIFSVASFSLLASERHSSGRCIAAGVLASIAVLFKVTAAIPVVVLVGIARTRVSAPKNERGRTWDKGPLWFLLGAGLPIVATVFYFWNLGALGAFLEWFLYLFHYAAAPIDAHWVKLGGPSALMIQSGLWFVVFAALAVATLFQAKKEKGVKLALASLLFLAGAIMSIAVQRRYFSYHTVVLGTFCVLVGSFTIRTWIARRPRLIIVATLLFSLCPLFYCKSWTGNIFLNYGTFVSLFWFPRVQGWVPDSLWNAAFTGPYDYSYAAHVELAEIIAARKPDTDSQLHIRGFDPTTYVLTGLFSPSRFSIEIPVKDRYLTKFRPAWLDEHERILRERPPRFFITHVGAIGDITRLQTRGYRLIASSGTLVLLERGYKLAQVVPKEVQRVFVDQTVTGLWDGKYRFNAVFHRDNVFELDFDRWHYTGTWSLSKQGKICTLWDTYGFANQLCYRIYRHPDGQYSAFEPSGREVAKRVQVVGNKDNFRATAERVRVSQYNP